MGDEEQDTGETETKWVKIPSKEHDPKNFDKNVEKLKILSYKSWCIKSFNAKPYLEKWDFHIYLENGKPKMAIRFVKDQIEEVQGEKNNGQIPFQYVEELKSYLKDQDLPFDNIKNNIKDAEKIKQEYEELKSKIGENPTPQSIFETAGIECEQNKDGLLIAL